LRNSFGSFAFDAKRRVQRASSLAADSAIRLILEINVREFPSAAVPHDKAGVQFLNGHGGGERVPSVVRQQPQDHQGDHDYVG